MSEYLDELIRSLEAEADQGRAEFRRLQNPYRNGKRSFDGYLKRITQRLESLRQLQKLENDKRAAWPSSPNQ